MYRQKTQATVINPYPNSPIPSNLPAGFTTVANFIASNQATLIAQMTPLTYNLPSLNVLIPTQQLFQDALNKIVLEYGWLEISPQDQNYLTNDIVNNFRRLCQLLILENIVRMNDILRNEYGHRSYRANSDQRVYEAVQDSLSASEMSTMSEVLADNTVSAQYQTFESGNYNSQGSGQSSRGYDGSTSVENQSSGSDTTEVGQVNQRSVQIQHAMPTQAIDGTTNNFPSATVSRYVSTVDGGMINVNRDLHVPDLNMAMANTANSNFGVTEANTSKITSTVDANVREQRQSDESSRGSDTYNSSSSTNNDMNSFAVDNTRSNNSGDASQTAEGHGETQSRTQSSSAYGTRESGFTTTAVFANQLKIMFDILYEFSTPFDWWLSRFTWLRGIF